MAELLTLELGEVPFLHPVGQFASEWERLRRERAMPLRKDFAPFQFPRFLPWLKLVEVDAESPTGYQTRVCGSELERIFDVVLTGKPYAIGIEGEALDRRIAEANLMGQTYKPSFSRAENPHPNRRHQILYRGLFPLGQEAMTHFIAIMAPTKIRMKMT